MSTDAPEDGLGRATEVPRDSFRARIRAQPGIREIYRLGVFVAGLLFIALGISLIALPGPLTIPPVLLGLWIWSAEFAFAERFFDSFQDKGRDAWEHARAHPVTTTLVTVGGLLAAAAAFWFMSSRGILEEATNAIF